MNVRTLARWLVVVALACAGLVGLANFAMADPTTVQNGNESTGSSAESAPVAAGNSTVMGSGPTAKDGATAAMVGDTNTAIRQDASATGEPVSAGSQHTDAAGGATVQNHNKTVGASASGDPVNAFNSLDAHNGPFASGNADASMVGDGNLDVSQDAHGRGGPARSGSQHTKVEDSIVQNTNQCGDAITDCGLALAGGVDVFNVYGDSTPSDPDQLPAPSGTGPVAVGSPTGDAVTASQVGNTDAVISQGAVGVSGAATNGSQETTGRRGTVANHNESVGGPGTEAESGFVTVGNLGFAWVGAVASSSGPFSSSSHQVGDADGDLDMDASGRSGNAVTGSQVTSFTGDQSGMLTVMNRSASEDDESVTGFVSAVSDVTAISGPFGRATGADADARLHGRSSFDIATDVFARSGDAGAGAQLTRAVGRPTVSNGNDSSGDTATSGDACAAPECGAPGGNALFVVAGPFANATNFDASAAQDGNDRAIVDVNARAVTGGAQSGVQSTDARQQSTVVNDNTSTDNDSVSGDATSGNDIVALSGPAADGSTADAEASMVGNGRADVIADAISATGEAVSGSQLTTARSDALVMGDNTSVGAAGVDAESGSSLAGNTGTFISGPAAGVAFADFTVIGDVVALGDALTSSAVGDPSASADLIGNANIVARLDARAFSGDALTATQDVLADGGDTLLHADVESARASSATACAHPSCGGDVTVDPDGPDGPLPPGPIFVPGGNAAVLIAGPAADVGALGTGDASSTLVGNANGHLVQRATANTLAANAGVQQVRNTDATVDANLDATGPEAGCVTTTADCIAVAANRAASVVGPVAASNGPRSATADQFGDASFDVDQRVGAVVGKASAGSQRITADRGAEVLADLESVGDAATAGPVTGVNTVGADLAGTIALGTLGPAAIAGAAATGDVHASQVGDTFLDITERTRVGSGDASATDQVLDIGPGDVVEVQDSSGPLGNTAVSAFASAYNEFLFDPTTDGGEALVGDITLHGVLDADAFSGDAVVGGTRLVTGAPSFPVSADSFTPFGLGSGSFTQDHDGPFRWYSGNFVGDTVAAGAL